MVKIRTATITDLAVVQAIGRQTFIDSFGKDNAAANMDHYLQTAFCEEQIRNELTEAGTYFFLAFDESTLAGYAKVRVSNEVLELLGNNAIELQRIYVINTFMGRGVGRELLTTCLRHAASHKFEWIWLGVWERNYNAQRFYLSAGFQKFGEHFFDMGDDRQTDWLMKRKIDPAKDI